MRVCILSDRQFEDALENAHWRKVSSLLYELFLGLQGFVFQQNKSRRCNCALNLLTHFCSDPPHVTFHVKYVEI